nr:unnamed protein product [Callosobruchus chinensis]
MLPANLAKSRAAGRGAYGELLMLQAAAAAAAAGGGTPAVPSAASALRYAPYPPPAALPAAVALHQHHPHHHPNPQLQYAAAAAAAAAAASVNHPLYEHLTGCKRVFAAPLRPLAARPLAYSMSDLLQIQGLEVPTVYTNAFHL